MTWQEELRTLDEDFSAGRITADEYRVRRDQVLSSAVAPPQDHGVGGNAEETQVVRPAQAPGPEQPTPQTENPDATQIVRNPTPSEPTPQYSAPDADRTQAVPHQDMFQQSPPHGMPQQHPASPAAGFPPPHAGYPPQPQDYQQPHWHSAQTQEEAPLWGGDEFPPIAPPAEPDWVSQGPEFGKDPEEKSRTGKIVGAVLAVVLLAGVAFGAWMLWGQGSGDPQGQPGGGGLPSEQPSTSVSTPTTPPPPPDPLPIAELPGRSEEHPEVTTFSDMEDVNYFNKKELAAYKKANADGTKFQVQHMSGDATAPIVLVMTDSGTKAAAAAKQLRKIQLDNGAKKAKNAPDNVYVTEFKQEKKAEIRAHYVSGNVLVRIEVKSNKGLTSARKQFSEVLNAQLEELPADGA